jgi:hypothetical protein
MDFEGNMYLSATLNSRVLSDTTFQIGLQLLPPLLLLIFPFVINITTTITTTTATPPLLSTNTILLPSLQ